MRFVYILEDDPKFQKEISEAIHIIDPKIQIRIFPKLENFANWIKHMMTTGPKAIAQAGLIQKFVPQAEVSDTEAHEVVMIVSKVEFLGPAQLNLMERTRQVFIDRKICSPDHPTAFVITAFDSPDFQLRKLQSKIINNVIFKPFDRLILAQHLASAIAGRKPPTHYLVANQKTNTNVELLKNVDIESISDVGMITVSEREIRVGAVAKYYGKTFVTNRHRSIFAICRECIPHPKEKGKFRASFTYFSAEQTQISNIRKLSRDRTATDFPFDWVKRVPIGSSELHVVLLDDEENTPSGLGGQIEKVFSSAKVTSYTNFSSFFADLDPAQAIQQRDSTLKTLGGANSVTLKFDMSGLTFLDVESEKKDLSTLFGISIRELKSKGNWFYQGLSDAAHKEKYRKFVQTSALASDNMLSLTLNDTQFLVKATHVVKADRKFSITLVEPTKDEQITWGRKNTRLQRPVHLVIASQALFRDGAKERWNNVKEQLRKRFNVEPKIIVTTKKEFSDDEIRHLSGFVSDIFIKPMDTVYFLQKLKCFLPHIREKGERFVIRSIAHVETVKAVYPVKVHEISEAGFTLTHEYNIDVGSFREVVLWQPYQISSPELHCTCNYVEESQNKKGEFICQFIFFGISDYFLKNIRIWIRNTYVNSKDGQQAS